MPLCIRTFAWNFNSIFFPAQKKMNVDMRKGERNQELNAFSPLEYLVYTRRIYRVGGNMTILHIFCFFSLTGKSFAVGD